MRLFNFFFAAFCNFDIIGERRLCKAIVLRECWGAQGFCIAFSRNILNSTANIGHPCRTPIVVRNKFSTFTVSTNAVMASRPKDFSHPLVDVIFFQDSPRRGEAIMPDSAKRCPKSTKLWKSSFRGSKYYTYQGWNNETRKDTNWLGNARLDGTRRHSTKVIQFRPHFGGQGDHSLHNDRCSVLIPLCQHFWVWRLSKNFLPLEDEDNWKSI